MQKRKIKILQISIKRRFDLKKNDIWKTQKSKFANFNSSVENFDIILQTLKVCVKLKEAFVLMML